MTSPAKRAIIIGMDGASMEIVKTMMEWGKVPNIKRLYDEGASRPMIGVFPTLTPPGWTALATGSWPGVSNHHQVAGYHLFTGGKWAPRPIGGDRDPETLDPSALQEQAERAAVGALDASCSA